MEQDTLFLQGNYVVKDSDWNTVVTKYIVAISLLELTVAGSYFGDPPENHTTCYLYTHLWFFPSGPWPLPWDQRWSMGHPQKHGKCLHIDTYPLGMFTLKVNNPFLKSAATV